MKIIHISFNKTKIFENVSLASAYTGAKAETQQNIFDRVATISEDNELLEGFFIEMTGIVTDRLKEFVISTEKSDAEFNMTLEVSNAYDDSLSASIKEDLFAAVVKGVIARWFRVTFPEKTGEWWNDSETLLSRAFAKLCMRRKPKRQ